MKNIPTKWSATNSELKRTIIPVILSLLGALIALYPNSPNNLTLPSRDSGVFLYVGWRLTNGEIPYRDVWDHKPPLIYFVDALGLSLTPDSLWGVWALQFLFIFLTILLIYKALDNAFGRIPAIASGIILASGLMTLMEEGNVTEEYALPFQALCLYFLVMGMEKEFPNKQIFWMGVFGGMAFCFKQTTIGIWIAFTILLILMRLNKKSTPIPGLLYLAAGWSIPIIFFAIYFQLHGSLSDFWDQAFSYNFLYIQKHEGLRRIVPVFIKGFAFLGQGWVLLFALAGWLSGLIHLWLERKSFLKGKNQLILFSLIALPIEIILILISGRSLLHYYLTPIPIMALLGGIFIYAVHQFVGNFLSIKSGKKNVVALALVSVLILAQIPKAKGYRAHMEDLAGNDRTDVVEYVVTHTDKNDKVLIIGAESVVNFLARREAPTRYVYQYPLNLTGNQQMFEEYINQILADNPVLIIDTRGSSDLTKNLYSSPQKRSEIVRNGVKYLGENYERVAQFDKWVVYRLKEDL